MEKEQQRLNSPECYFNAIIEELRPKRDKMAKFLEDVGVVPTIPEAGYFMVADFSNFSKLTCYAIVVGMDRRLPGHHKLRPALARPNIQPNSVCRLSSLELDMGPFLLTQFTP